MKKEYRLLAGIVERCLQIDKIAHSTYSRILKTCRQPELQEFWRTVAEEEKSHMEFWEEARTACRQAKLPIMLENVAATHDELTIMSNRLKRLTDSFPDWGTPAQEIMLAYMIESYLFDPTFMTIFNGFHFIRPDIADNYETHICRFIDVMRHYQGQKAPVEIEIFGKTLYNLYMLNKRLAHESAADPLTGLLNRRGFFNMVNPTLGFLVQNQVPAGVIMLDIDDFKQLNSLHGHDAGDLALVAVAATVRKVLRNADKIGRYGGDEFIVFIERQNVRSLKLLCERIRKNVEQHAGKVYGSPLSISLGAACSCLSAPPEEALAALIKQADTNLYQAKNEGKNCRVVS